MNKTINSAQSDHNDELLPEYDFDYQQSKPNRFANLTSPSRTIAVTLDEDIAQIFTNSAQVNHALRSLLTALPNPPQS